MSSGQRAQMIIASAGSGKTYSITKEVVGRVNNVSDSSQLLAALKQIIIMTFTNKATDELRQRIINELSGCPSDIYNTFLFHHRALTISTIDSLLYEIIKPLLLLIKKDNPANLIVNEGEIVADVVKRLLIKSITSHGDFMQVVQSIVNKKVDEGKRVNLDTELRNLVWEYLKFKGRGLKLYSPNENIYSRIKSGIDEWIKRQYQMIYKEVRTFMGQVANVYQYTIGIDIKAIPAFKKDYGFAGNKTKKFDVLVGFIKHEENDLSYEQIKALVDSLRTGKGIEQFLWYENNVKESLEDILSKEKKEVFNDNWEDQYASEMKPLSVSKEIFALLDFVEKDLKNSIFAIYLWNHINDTVKDILTEKHAILLKNIPDVLRELLREGNGNLPYVYEYVGSRFTQYFTDEFQDTSLPQYEALKPLWEEAVSIAGEVVVVGDIKQSIYQWRDADPLIMANRFPTELKPEERTLSSNWRSSPVIVEFNNRVFGEIMPNQIVEQRKELIDYQKYRYREQEDGFHLENILRQWYDKEKVKQKAERDYDGTVVVRQVIFPDKSSINKREKGKLQVIVKDIMKVIDDLVQNRDFRYGDVTILCRKSKTLRHIASELLANGYPIQVTAGLKMRHDPSALLMHRILAGQLHKMKDRVPTLILVEVASLLCRISDASEDNGICAQNIYYKLAESQDKIWIDNESFSSLSEMVLALADRFMNVFTELRDNPRWIEGLQAFLNFVRLAENKGINTLQELVEYWDAENHEFDLTEDDSISQNQISLMTIHKAKGLQNKVILIPDLYDWSFELDSRNDTWIPVPVKAIKEFLQEIDNNTPLFEDATDDEHILIKVPSAGKLTALRKLDRNYGDGSSISGIVKAFSDFEARYIFETLNLMYVGFTRPEQALFLWTTVKVRKNGKGQNETPKTAEDLVNYLVTNEHIGFVLGQEEELEQLDDSNEDSVKVKVFFKGNYKNLSVKENQELSNRNSGVEVEKRTLGENQTWKAHTDKFFDVNFPINKTTIKDFDNYPVIMGTYLHKLVAQVKSINDIEQLNIDRENKIKLKQWLQHEELKKFNDWEVETEVPLFYHNRMFYVDRLYTNSNEVVIVDFKSVDDPSQSPLLKRWEEQVKTYANILRQQGKHVRGTYIVGFKKAVTVNIT